MLLLSPHNAAFVALTYYVDIEEKIMSHWQIDVPWIIPLLVRQLLVVVVETCVGRSFLHGQGTALCYAHVLVVCVAPRVDRAPRRARGARRYDSHFIV